MSIGGPCSVLDTMFEASSSSVLRTSPGSEGAIFSNSASIRLCSLSSGRPAEVLNGPGLKRFPCRWWLVLRLMKGRRPRLRVQGCFSEGRGGAETAFSGKWLSLFHSQQQ